MRPRGTNFGGRPWKTKGFRITETRIRIDYQLSGPPSLFPILQSSWTREDWKIVGESTHYRLVPL
ncbi:KRR1 small subunit processome component [Gossypium arboreum]|uniref:KRR1 small subunit processome component n=1 Tax=Gossypium arboreum TaxID=29729 RepID=A0A0B0P3Y5_GOSAR|nr:KRR1 small subunit processome component [Gossypium arboreum]